MMPGNKKSVPEIRIAEDGMPEHGGSLAKPEDPRDAECPWCGQPGEYCYCHDILLGCPDDCPKD